MLCCVISILVDSHFLASMERLSAVIGRFAGGSWGQSLHKTGWDSVDTGSMLEVQVVDIIHLSREVGKNIAETYSLYN